VIVRSAPRHVEPAPHCEFNANKDSVEYLDTFRYLEHFENIADSESQPSPAPLPQTETYPSTGTLLSDYIGELWNSDTHGYHETNLQDNHY
jgi:hypothetical protein